MSQDREAAREAEVESGAKSLLKVRDVCEMLNLSQPYVYQLMDVGELPYVRFGKARRIKQADVEELIRRNTVGRANKAP